jgi:hypothetical protein
VALLIYDQDEYIQHLVHWEINTFIIIFLGYGYLLFEPLSRPDASEIISVLLMVALSLHILYRAAGNVIHYRGKQTLVIMIYLLEGFAELSF